MCAAMGCPVNLAFDFCERESSLQSVFKIGATLQMSLNISRSRRFYGDWPIATISIFFGLVRLTSWMTCPIVLNWSGASLLWAFIWMPYIYPKMMKRSLMASACSDGFPGKLKVAIVSCLSTKLKEPFSRSKDVMTWVSSSGSWEFWESRGSNSQNMQEREPITAWTILDLKKWTICGVAK